MENKQLKKLVKKLIKLSEETRDCFSPWFFEGIPNEDMNEEELEDILLPYQDDEYALFQKETRNQFKLLIEFRQLIEQLINISKNNIDDILINQSLLNNLKKNKLNELMIECCRHGESNGEWANGDMFDDSLSIASRQSNIEMVIDLIIDLSNEQTN